MRKKKIPSCSNLALYKKRFKKIFTCFAFNPNLTSHRCKNCFSGWINFDSGSTFNFDCSCSSHRCTKSVIDITRYCLHIPGKKGLINLHSSKKHVFIFKMGFGMSFHFQNVAFFHNVLSCERFREVFFPFSENCKQ